MKTKLTIIFLMFSLWTVAQTTVHFSENLQFLSPFKKELKLVIVVDNIAEYNSDKPIIVQVFSDLDDPLPLGITTVRGIDKVIFPKQYTKGVEVRIPINLSALQGKSNFKLYLRKKGENEHFNIVQNSQAVVLDKNIPELREPSNVNASYGIYVGTNFDFSTNFEAKDIHYEIDISLFNLFKSRWGLKAGMYKNTNSRYPEDFILRPEHYVLVGEYTNEDESLDGHIYNMIETGMAPRISTESLGFYFSLPYKLIESSRLKVFVSPYLELIERRETYSYEVVYESILSTEVTSFDLGFSTPPSLPRQVYSTYWEGYFGLSMPVYYRDLGEGFEVAITPVFGAGTPGPYANFWTFYTEIPDYDYVKIVKDHSKMLFFSAFQFNVIVNPKETLGLKLGADIRKYFGEGRKPIVSVNLSTKLEIGKLFKFTKG